MSGKELFDKIIEEKKLTEIDTVDLMQQIIKAVNYCHKQKVVHRLFIII